NERKNDNFTRAILKLADIYYKNENYAEARDWYKRLLDNSSSSKERSIAWVSLMEVYYNLGVYDSVAYYGEQLLNHSKYSLDANKATLYLGKVAYVAGDKEKAIDY